MSEIDFHDPIFLAAQFPEVSQTLPKLIRAVKDARKAVYRQNSIYRKRARRYDFSVLALATCSTMLAAMTASSLLPAEYRPVSSLILSFITAVTAAVAAWQTSVQTRTRLISGTKAGLSLDEMLGSINQVIFRAYENQLIGKNSILDQSLVDQWWTQLRNILRSDYEEYIKEWSNRPAVPSRPST